MSILINGMEMPTSCRACMFSRTDIRNVDWCVLTEKDLPCDCPLIPVPDHGDLIDYDFCLKNYELLHDDDGNPVYAVRMRDINNAPTIIPADKEKRQ